MFVLPSTATRMVPVFQGLGMAGGGGKMLAALTAVALEGDRLLAPGKAAAGVGIVAASVNPLGDNSNIRRSLS